jgi:hypothetical protein
LRFNFLDHVLRRVVYANVNAADIFVGTLAVARHQGGVLPEVFGQVDADDVILFLRESLDDAPHVVGTTVVHQHNLVTVARALGGHLALDFVHHGGDGLFGTVAGNYIYDESIKNQIDQWSKYTFRRNKALRHLLPRLSS